jgi:hypothetical protein
MRWPLIHCTLLLPLSTSPPTVGAANDFIDLSAEDLQESMIAFVNLSTVPGLDGATLNVDSSIRDSDLVRSSLGYAASFTIKDRVADGYWGLALAYGSLEDKVNTRDKLGRPLQLDADREVLSLRGSLGAVLPVDRHFAVRPYLSVSVANLETDATFRAPGDIGVLPSPYLRSEVDALTTSATVVALYDRWYSDWRLELSGQYTTAYTDTFNGSRSSLETSGWTDTMQFRFRLSGATGWRTDGRPWRWNAYAHHTRFPGLNEIALGFTHYTELGVGMEYEWNIRPLDWFGLRFIGLKAGLIVGDDLEGFSVGLAF